VAAWRGVVLAVLGLSVLAGCSWKATEFPGAYLASPYPAPDGFVLADESNDLGWLDAQGMTENPQEVSSGEVQFIGPDVNPSRAWLAYFVEPARNRATDPHTVVSWAFEFPNPDEALAWATGMCQYIPRYHRVLADQEHVAFLAPAGESDAVQRAVDQWAKAIGGATAAKEACPVS
jgi:hypothetical protein